MYTTQHFFFLLGQTLSTNTQINNTQQRIRSIVVVLSQIKFLATYGTRSSDSLHSFLVGVSLKGYTVLLLCEMKTEAEWYTCSLGPSPRVINSLQNQTCMSRYTISGQLWGPPAFQQRCEVVGLCTRPHLSWWDTLRDP